MNRRMLDVTTHASVALAGLLLGATIGVWWGLILIVVSFAVGVGLAATSDP